MNVVFDFAGVLFAWDPLALLRRLLPEQAPDETSARALAADFFQAYEGDWAEFDRGVLSADDLAPHISHRTGLAVADVSRVISAVPEAFEPMRPMLALLQRLRERGHRLFYLSNMPAPYATLLEARHAFVHDFEAGVFSSRVHLIKPEPAIFAHAVKSFGIDAHDTLFIDDMAANTRAARAAGWQAINFLSDAQCEADLARLGLFAAV